VLVNRYIRPLEALATTSSRDLGYDQGCNAPVLTARLIETPVSARRKAVV